jgi:hypothetical protein
MILIRGFTKKDLKMMPFGKKIAASLNKRGLL